MTHSQRPQTWCHSLMRSWWRWCRVQTSLWWLVPGGCWGCDGRRLCCYVLQGPIENVGDNIFCPTTSNLVYWMQKLKPTGKKILCGPLSFFDGFLKRPLDGFRNRIRWTPPFSSPSSSRGGCSGHLEEKPLRLEWWPLISECTDLVETISIGLTWMSCQ